MGASLSITLTQGTQDVVNNRTLVTATVKVTATGATWNGYSRPGTLVLDGESYSFSKGFAKGTTTTLYTVNKWCYHNSVGAKTVSASASYNTGVSPGTISASASKPLTTIPRATEPTLSTSSVELGSDVTINLPRKASAFTHTVIYSIGAASGTIVTGAGTSVKWTPPISLASELPNATSGTVVIKVKTYSGGTLIGTKTINLTITVPAHVKPSVTIQVDDATNNLEMFGYYLVGYSRYKVTATEKTMYGATIAKRKTVMNGVTYTSLNPTSGPITSLTNDNVVCTVTDSRGRTASVTINDLPTRIYTPPVIVSYLTPSRCTADGVPDEDGDYIKTGFTFIFDDIGGTNAAAAKIKARPRISETYSYEVIVASGEEIILPADHNYTYFILFEVTDTLGSKVPYEYRLNTHDAVLSAKLGYKLVVGKAAELGTPEKPVFESAWHTVLTTVETSGNATLDSLNVVKDSTFNGNVAIKGDLTLDVDQAFLDKWSSVFGTGGGVVHLLDMILHIGYVIQTTNAAFDPNALYPWQVWERYAKGRVLVGVDEADTTFSAAGKTAGAKTHTLTVDQMPSHAHGMGYATCWDGVKSSGWIVGANSGSRVDRTSYAGGGKAHNNMQPSIAVYMWRRIE